MHYTKRQVQKQKKINSKPQKGFFKRSCTERKAVPQRKSKFKTPRKTLKSLGLNAKEGDKAKIYLNKDGTIHFETYKNANISKKVYSEQPTNLVKKIQISPNKLNRATTKDYNTFIILLKLLFNKTRNKVI